MLSILLPALACLRSAPAFLSRSFPASLTRSALPLMELNMDLLSRRIESISTPPVPIRMCVLSCLLPRQRMTMTVRAETYKLLEGLCASEATLGVLGTSDGRVLRHGVEATIADLTSHTDGSGRATLVGGRLFRTLKELPSECVLSQAVPRMSPVHYLDLNLQDEIEKKREPNSRTLDLCARELGPLVMRWADLVRLTGRERTPGQLDDAFRALGEMPTADHPSERCEESHLCVAALFLPPFSAARFGHT